MYTLNLEWEAVQSMVVQVLKEDYKGIHADLKKDYQHPEDKAFSIKAKEAFEVLFRYYMAPSEAEEYINKVEEGDDEEEITIQLDAETHQKAIEIAVYSAINSYLQEQKDAVNRQINLGNTES